MGVKNTLIIFLIAMLFWAGLYYVSNILLPECQNSCVVKLK